MPNSGLPQFQARQFDVQRQQSNKTLLDRQISVPWAVVTGGSGDVDLRRLGYGADELKNNLLVQRGVNGGRIGAITLNQDPSVMKPGTGVVEHHEGTSAWGQGRIEKQFPFLETVLPTPAGPCTPGSPAAVNPYPGCNVYDPTSPCPPGGIVWP